MITDEERQEIIDAAVEKALLLLPTVMGNLMAQQAGYSKINSQFYKDNPDFTTHKDMVAAIVELVDGQNPTLTYDEKLRKAIPLIREKLALIKGMDTEGVSLRPDRSFDGPLTIERPTNHGEF